MRQFRRLCEREAAAVALHKGIFGLVFTSGFSVRLVKDNRKFPENSAFPNPLKVKRVGKFH